MKYLPFIPLLLILFLSCSSQREIKGEVFIATNGGQNIKIGAADVLLMQSNPSEINRIGYEGLVKMPAFKNAVTDSDGKFSFTVPSGEYALVVSSSRNVIGSVEFYHWAVLVDVRNGNAIVSLNNQNLEGK